jgi:hypothetical protein
MPESNGVASVPAADRFARLTWAVDDTSFELSGYRFLVQDLSTVVDDEAFRFYKPRPMVDQYEQFLTQVPFVPETVLELGIWDGGSVAFWTELLAPRRYLAVDKDTRGDSAYFRRYVTDNGLDDVIDCRWGVDQGDHDALWTLLADHDLPLVDLVIDDASHSYGPTLASFAGLFPRVRPGGFYIVEDWSWPYREPYRRKDHPWALRPTLLPIVDDIMAVLGSAGGAISQVMSFPDFVAVQRGPTPLPPDFDLRTQITPPERPALRLAADRAKRYGRKAVTVTRQAVARVTDR